MAIYPVIVGLYECLPHAMSSDQGQSEAVTFSAAPELLARKVAI